MNLVWGSLAALALVVVALAAYGLSYAAWANRKWPPEGAFVEAHGVRVHVVRAGLDPGVSPTVLAIHGASANARELMQPLAAELAEEMTLLALDRPGYGHSGRPEGAHRLEVQAAMAAQVLEAQGVSRAIVVGHSLGAATALRLALDRPDLVAGLVLASPASHPYPGGNAWHVELTATPIVGALFAWTAAPLFGPSLAPPAIAKTFRPAAPPAGYYEAAGVGLLFRPSTFLANGLDVSAANAEFTAQAPNYQAIRAPTLIVSTDHDSVVSPRIHADALARTIPGAKVIVIPGAGHMPHRLAPSQLADAIRQVAAMAAAPAGE